MRCMHHLRAALGERSNLHVGFSATTPLFEEETYRKVCRMGRDAPISAKMNYAHLHQGAILGHPSWHVPMALFLQVSSSLAPMQVCWRMLHCPAAKQRMATGQGREVFFPRHRCSVERTEYLMRFFCLVISIYIVIALYYDMLIYLYRYCVICLWRCLSIFLLHALAWGYSFLYIYILYLFLTSTSIFLLLWLPSLNHLAFYGAKVWRFCQIPNTRRCLIR